MFFAQFWSKMNRITQYFSSNSSDQSDVSLRKTTKRSVKSKPGYVQLLKDLNDGEYDNIGKSRKIYLCIRTTMHGFGVQDKYLQLKTVQFHFDTMHNVMYICQTTSTISRISFGWCTLFKDNSLSQFYCPGLFSLFYTHT